MSRTNIIIKLSSFKDQERKLIALLYPDLVAETSSHSIGDPLGSGSFDTSQIRMFSLYGYIYICC